MSFLITISILQAEIRADRERERFSPPLAGGHPPEQRHHKEEVPQAGGQGGLAHGAGEEGQGQLELEANVGSQGTLQMA